MSAVKQTCNALGLQHASEEVMCLNSEGMEVERILSRVKDVPLFLHTVTAGHNTSPDVIVSLDGGKGKIIVIASVFYLDDDGDNTTSEEYLLAQIDEIPENRHNINLMLKALGFPLAEKGV